jgi:hypothetical protein
VDLRTLLFLVVDLPFFLAPYTVIEQGLGEQRLRERERERLQDLKSSMVRQGPLASTPHPDTNIDQKTHTHPHTHTNLARLGRCFAFPGGFAGRFTGRRGRRRGARRRRGNEQSSPKTVRVIVRFHHIHTGLLERRREISHRENQLPLLHEYKWE